MYRANTERSQEKNDRNERTHRCTKVTCATRTRRKSSRDITTRSDVLPHHAVSAARVSQKNARCDAGGIARREPSRSFSPSIIKGRFSPTMLEGARQRASKERNHGRFE